MLRATSAGSPSPQVSSPSESSPIIAGSSTGTKLILGLLECPLQRGVSTCSDTTDDLPCLFRVSLIGWKVNRDIGSGLRQAFRERAKHVRRLVIRERSIFSERIKQH